MTDKIPLKPCGKIVLVKIEDVKLFSVGGIELAPQTVSQERAKKCQATIIEFGPKAFHGYIEGVECNGPDDWGVKIGDKIEFRRAFGEVPYSDETELYKIIEDKDILGVVPV